MRIIIQTNKVDFSTMSGTLIFKLFKIAEKLQESKLTNDQMFRLFLINQDEFNQIQKYLVFSDGEISGLNFVSSFNKNKEYVQKSRNKIKSTDVNDVFINDKKPSIVVKKEKKSIVNSEEAELLLTSYNQIFTGSKVCLIKAVGNKMLLQVKNLHKEYGKDKTLGNFLADYYEILVKNKGIMNGWTNNNTGELYRPTFDYLHRAKTYEKYFNQIK